MAGPLGGRIEMNNLVKCKLACEMLPRARAHLQVCIYYDEAKNDTLTSMELATAPQSTNSYNINHDCAHATHTRLAGFVTNVKLKRI